MTGGIDDLLELAEEAIAYAPDYFRQKWQLDERLTELKRRLAPVGATMTTHADYGDLRCGASHPSRVQLYLHDNRMAAMRTDLPPDLTITIPVWWLHITSGCAGLVTDARRAAQIDALNTVFAVANIQFRTAGVTCHDAPDLYTPDPRSAEERRARAMVQITDALLVLTVGRAPAIAGAVGWALFPWERDGLPFFDGVTVWHETLPGGSARGQNLGLTMAHEVGHWLGLYHTFQGGCDRVGDHVSDTPAQAYPNRGAPAPGEWVGCGGKPGPIGNVMDYCDEAAMTGFTTGQCRRMRDTIAAYRPELLHD